jgi:hypothetical protein
MKPQLLRSIFVLLVSWPLSSARAEVSYWQQSLHYQMNVRLNPQAQALSGESTITYHNNSPDTLDRIYLHLYPNAFKNSASTFAREARRRYSGESITPENNGYIDILEFRIARQDSGVVPSDAPIVAYRVDDTILEAKLPERLAPQQSMQLYIKFYEKVPSLIVRGGRQGNQYDFGQWYPKPAVYDQNGWHPDQYHANGEFYGEFGTFDVTITLPYNYVVCATGVPIAGDPGWNWVAVDTSLTDEQWQARYEQQLAMIDSLTEEYKERTVTFQAEQVHDFAWAACPDFVYERGEWQGIPIHVLYRSYDRDGWSKKVAQRGRRVLEWLSTRFGRYPYPQLTIMHGLMGGGMEYPMLVMNSGPWESLISHEVGHIYFYGILANDELAEAWLDEGFTSYQEYWYQHAKFNRWGYDQEDIPDTTSWKFKLNPGLTTKDRTTGYLVDYLTSGFNEPIAQYAHKFQGGYGINVYTKGAAFLGMLHYIVGDSLWDSICHTYFDRWKFKHVNEQRFRQVVEDVTGENFGWYFDQWLHRTVVVDYALGKITQAKQANGQWQTMVEIRRNDNGIMPVDVQLTTKNGQRLLQRWDGKAKSGQLVFVTDSRADRVVLDPQDMILDKNRLNNGDWEFQFLPDLPSGYYRPRNRYVIRYAPQAWYNDVDGLWLGARIRGSYLEKFYPIELSLSYGLKSRRAGYELKLGRRVIPNSDRLHFDLSVIHREGRGLGDLRLLYQWSRERYTPPFYDLTLSFQTSQLLKGQERYAQRKIEAAGNSTAVSEWVPGRVSKIGGSFGLSLFQRGWASVLKVTAETAQSLWGSEFDFSKLQTELSFNAGSGSHRFYGRMFAGNSWGHSLPLQEKFFTDGANPLERFQKFYLRSVAALPPELHYHCPGGGNLRGYIDQPLATERILAITTEWRSGILTPLIRKLFSRRTTLRMYPFFDFARVQVRGEKYQNLMDAGIGLQFSPVIFSQRLNFRCDFPIWVSDPLVGQRATKFRWVLSFQNAISSFF